jgi:hypothetical protein
VLNWRIGIFGLVMGMNSSLETVLRFKNSAGDEFGYDMDICNKLSWLILQIDSS